MYFRDNPGYRLGFLAGAHARLGAAPVAERIR